jgi:hypothetical protein
MVWWWWYGTTTTFAPFFSFSLGRRLRKSGCVHPHPHWNPVYAYTILCYILHLIGSRSSIQWNNRVRVYLMACVRWNVEGLEQKKREKEQSDRWTLHPPTLHTCPKNIPSVVEYHHHTVQHNSRRVWSIYHRERESGKKRLWDWKRDLPFHIYTSYSRYYHWYRSEWK